MPPPSARFERPSELRLLAKCVTMASAMVTTTDFRAIHTICGVPKPMAGPRKPAASQQDSSPPPLHMRSLLHSVESTPAGGAHPLHTCTPHTRSTRARHAANPAVDPMGGCPTHSRHHHHTGVCTCPYVATAAVVVAPMGARLSPVRVRSSVESCPTPACGSTVGTRSTHLVRGDPQ